MDLSYYSTALINNTSPLISEGNGGIWQIRPGAYSSIIINDGEIHRLSFSSYATAHISGGQFDQIWSYYASPDAARITLICNPGYQITYTGGLATAISGIWRDGSAFNIQLVNPSGNSPVLSNMTIIPEPMSIFLLGLGGLLIVRKNKTENWKRKVKMSTRIWKTIFLVWAIFLSIGDLAQAVPVTIKITGVVTEITGLEPYPYNETIYPGTTFTGSYTYDSTAIGEYQQPGRGHYFHNSPCGFNLSLAGYEFKTVENHDSRFEIWLFNDFSLPLPQYDGYMVQSYENIPLSTGLSVYIISWILRDNTHTALSSIVLPVDAPDINAWNYNLFSIGCGGLGIDSPLFTIWGTVTEAVLIPEPATMLLLAIGGLFLRQKRK